MFESTSIIRNEPGAVTVLIGSNGSGKSRLLRDYCLRLAQNREQVLAIAPSLYDRFRGIKHRCFRSLVARRGQRGVREVLSNALRRAYISDPQILKNLNRALAYTRFDPSIGIRIAEVAPANLETAVSTLTTAEISVIRESLERWKRLSGPDNIVRFHIDSHSFKELDVLSLGALARHETALRRLRVISPIEYFLFRSGREIPVLEACSGEITYISSIAFIAANIRPHAAIVVDEPETSMHPTWQSGYVAGLLDLFSYYEPRIVISTHSPIIISGADSAHGALTVYELREGGARLFPNDRFSLEEMYDRLFGLITPKNHHLSKRAITLLNALNARKITLDETLKQLESLKSRSYDERQKETIDKIGALARKVEAEVA